MALRPLFSRVLIAREKMQSTSRIIIPDDVSKRNAPAKGTVIAVGPTCDPSIEVGQVVLFGRYAGDWIKDGEQEVYIAQDEDILAIEE